MPLSVRQHSANAEVVSFVGLRDSDEHIALVLPRPVGAPEPDSAPLVRIHSECLTGDVFGSARCDCGAQLEESLELMADQGGVICYLRQEGRGIGLYNKLDAYRLQDNGYDTLEANLALDLPGDARAYGVATEMLKALDLTSVRLLTNNPDKARDLHATGINVTEVVGTSTHVTDHNRNYLRTKATRLLHQLDA
ncbi:GTP cyclohydrolase II [Actinopolyspora halophila]|uniref:GTP cyclohydrolase II n=1 Tax=Actinopolyspora halophila TaxID=1850 RepID=UPI000525241F|nr:GTP cyclohydrolase II [Actinopolyspora halophila]